MTGKADKAVRIEELAGGCVAAVTNAVGVELDFTPDTLPILDHYAKQAEAPDGEVLKLLGSMCGAYFGEVVRLRLPGARWHVEEKMERWRIEHDGVFLWFNPAGVAVEVLRDEDAPGYFAHLSMAADERIAVEAALERLGGDVDQHDYYRFTSRFEVLELAHATLLGLRNAKGDRHLSYGPAVYAAAARTEADEGPAPS
jgi:hypothetical protein